MVSPPLRIVYLGTPEFAIPSLQALIASVHHVVSVVSQPDRPRGRGHHLAPTATKRLALEHAIPVLQPEKMRDEGFLDSIRALQPDLGVVAAYGRLLPEALLRIPRLGMINVHASLLPRWRGAAPVHRAVIAGDTETGATIMRVVRDLDAGPLFAAVRRPIGPDETSPEVERALAELGATLLIEVVDELSEGRATETPQDESLVTLAPKLTRDEGILDWNLPAIRIHNLVRGLQPWPLVSTRIAGDRTLLRRTAVLDERTEAAPGTVIRAERDFLDVATGEAGVLRLVALQPEGRRVMSARALLAGRTIVPGLPLES
jgi:methionyl-tRNA formyltransferase